MLLGLSMPLLFLSEVCELHGDRQQHKERSGREVAEDCNDESERQTDESHLVQSFSTNCPAQSPIQKQNQVAHG